jgi:integrase
VTVKGLKRKAEHELQKILVAVQDRKARSSSASLERVLTEWYAQARQSQISSSTAHGHAWRIRDHLLPTLGAVPVDALTAGDIDQEYGRMARVGASYYAIRQTHVALRSALSQAVKWEQLNRNPASLATLPQAPSTEMRAPTVEQLTELLKEAKASHPQWEAMIALAALTGLRRGELCALRWGDLDGSMLNVRRSLTYTPATGVVEGPTKTRQERRVAVDELALAIIQRQMSELSQASQELELPLDSNPFLFYGEPDGSKALHPDSITKVFRRIADKYGWKELHFHTLRHFSATQLIAAGVDIRTVSEVPQGK